MLRDPQEYVDGVLRQERLMLARTITLIESTLPTHQELARTIVDRLLPHTGKGFRIGITGVPGAGKALILKVLATCLQNWAIKSRFWQSIQAAVKAVGPSSVIKPAWKSWPSIPMPLSALLRQAEPWVV